MDYSNFIKTFYIVALKNLKEYRNYYGRIVQVSNGLDIPDDFFHVEENESMFLPSRLLNVDAPTNYFIDFMDYYIKLMPELGIVLADKQRIRKLYDNAVDMGFLEDDEKAISYIELVVKIGIDSLETKNILEK